MKFVLVDGKICVATHLTCDKELETQNVSSATSMQSTQVTVGQTITGEMLLFRRGELPEIFRDDGVVKKIQVEFARDDEYYTLDDVIFTSCRPMDDAYEKCEAAYLEYAATDISVERVAKDINSRVSI